MVALKRIQICLLAMLLLTAQILIPVSAAPIDQMPIATAAYYGRDILSTLPNAQKLLYVYDQVVAGVEASAAEISVYNGTDPVSEDEFSMVYDAYRRDHTEHFWLGNTYQLTMNSVSILTLRPAYVFEGESLVQAKQAFAAAAREYLSYIDDEMSDFEKELILHDRLAENVSYITSANAHNAYGALVEGKAVCEGYAEALQYLCQCAGMQTFIATGSSYNPTTQVAEGHAWNFIKIDGKFYQVDLTWNDQGATLYHAYFNVTQELISKGHSLDPAPYPLPDCTQTDANYFEVKGGAVTASSCTVAEIVELFRRGGSKIHVFVKDDPDAFWQWCSQNIQQIVMDLQMTGSISYGYAKLGNELVLTLQSDSCQHTSLTKMNANPGDCTHNGNTEYFVCACGAWFADAAGNTEITDKNAVILRAPGHSWTEKLETADRLRGHGEDCQSHDTYWYGCSACDEVSTSIYFEVEATGDHLYGESWITNENEHMKKCDLCLVEKDRGAHEDANEDGICDLCLYTPQSQEQDTEQGTDEIPTGAPLEEETDETPTEEQTGEKDHVTPPADGDTTGDISELINLLLENPTYLAIGGGVIAFLLLLILIAAFRRR